MLNKLRLAHNINRFYKIFGAKLNVVPAHTKLRDLKNHDFLLGVKHDIYEVLETSIYTFNEDAYKTHAWLVNINNEINSIREGWCSHERIKTCISFMALILITLLLGIYLGRHITIRQAELLDTTDTGYFINFNGEVHTYTFD